MGQYPKVIDLIGEAENGILVLPDFQRSFIWEPERVRELLVSVLGNYFVGSILILQQFSDQSPFALKLVEGVMQTNSAAKKQSFVKVLLDGQQRITALFYALNEPGIHLNNTESSYRFYLNFDKALTEDWDSAVEAVNLSDKKRLSEASKNPRTVPFKTLKNLEELAERFQRDPQFAKIYKIASDFLNREIYTIELPKETTPERIVETFERINRTGKPLTAFELLTARLYKSGIKLRELLEAAEKDFRFTKQVEPDFITKVVTVLRGKEPKRKLILDLDPTNFPEDWERACESLDDAFTRLLDTKNGYGALDFDKWVPYSTMIVPLACLLDYIKTNKLESKTNYDKIDRWYWISVFANRYDQAADSTSFSDVNAMKIWLSDDSKVPDFISNFDLMALDWRLEKQRSAIYRGVLNLVSLEGALDYQTGQPPQFDPKRTQDDHIFPKSVFRVDAFPNRTLITKNQEKSDRVPSDYFKELLDKHGRSQLVAILKSHLIPEAALDSLLSDKIEDFLQMRSYTILNKIRSKVSLPEVPFDKFDYVGMPTSVPLVSARVETEEE